MKNLTDITMEMAGSEAEGSKKDCCSYQGSKMDDRRIHRAGLCIINLGTLFARCPRLQNFNGVDIGKFPMFPTPRRKKTKETREINHFSNWNAKMKPLFYGKVGAPKSLYFISNFYFQRSISAVEAGLT